MFLPSYFRRILLVLYFISFSKWICGLYGVFLIYCRNSIFKKALKFIKTSNSLKPKFISLYSTGEDNCSPIFLKQKLKGVKVKYITSHNNCNKGYCICKSTKILKENEIEYAFYDPNQGI